MNNEWWIVNNEIQPVGADNRAKRCPRVYSWGRERRLLRCSIHESPIRHLQNGSSRRRSRLRARAPRGLNVHRTFIQYPRFRFATPTIPLRHLRWHLPQCGRHNMARPLGELSALPTERVILHSAFSILHLCHSHSSFAFTRQRRGFHFQLKKARVTSLFFYLFLKNWYR